MRRWLLACVVLLPPAALLGLLWWTAEGPNYTRIEPGLYVGGYVEAPPWGTGFVLNLCEQADPYRAEHHVHEPITDGPPAPSLEWLRRMADLVAGHRAEGRTVFVHCRNGASRSAMVALAFLMREHGWTLDEALASARARRDVIRPNPAFMALLRRWERALKRDEG